MERLNDRGFQEDDLNLIRQEMLVHENAADGEDLLSDVYLNGKAISGAVGLSEVQWEENAPSLRRELRKGRRDMCSIPDDHISPRRFALFMARSVLRNIREGVQPC